MIDSFLSLLSFFAPPRSVSLSITATPHFPSLTSLRSLSQGSTNSNMMDVQVGGHKKRVRRSSLLNAKKLYEDAQMARKVKQYLSNLAVETDEEKHQIMSLQCEPSYSTRESSFFFFFYPPYHLLSECNNLYFLFWAQTPPYRPFTYRHRAACILINFFKYEQFMN